MNPLLRLLFVSLSVGAFDVGAVQPRPCLNGAPLGQSFSIAVTRVDRDGLIAKNDSASIGLTRLPAVVTQLARTGDALAGISIPLPSGPNKRFSLRHPQASSPWAHGSLHGRGGPLPFDPRYRLVLTVGRPSLSGVGRSEALPPDAPVTLEGWCLAAWVESDPSNTTLSWLAWLPDDGQGCRF